MCALAISVWVHQVCNLSDIAQGEVEATEHKSAVTSRSVKAAQDTCAISSTTAPTLHQDPVATLQA